MRHEDGKFHAGILDDSYTWIDVYGREHDLVTMDTDYLENVLTFLLDGALHYWRCYMQQVEGINPYELSNAAHARFFSMDKKAAQRWMLRTPLVQAIMQQIVERYGTV